MTVKDQGENTETGTPLEQTPDAQVQQDASVETSEESAPSSSATDTNEQVNEPASMEDAIADALAAGQSAEAEPEKGDEAKPTETGDKGETAEAKPDDESTATAETGDDNQTDDDPTEDELKALKPNVQKRVAKLLHQRNEARRSAEAHEADATEYRNIREFVDQNNLEDREVADLFKFGALVKSTDGTKLDQALEIVMPIVRNLMVATGRSVPDDLRTKVDSGELTEELARQMGKDRFRAASAERTVTRVQEQATERETQSQQQAQQQNANSIREAVSAWHESTKLSDPDFGMKADAMNAAARAIIAERGQPKTPDQAVQFAKDAHQKATTWLTAGRPAKSATRPTPGNGTNGNRSQVTAQPQTLEEAIRAGLAATP